ncbi:hypothetical protein AALP_AA3G278600 [Arabis alpina]|uniref:Uncharacterized protein n=1 Tax=Arabis alpina TaxID=50452 RepID=A0A087HC61_ARAAL|nr:hypothetical protein AALP_AA3G278600 [Arabis alpina]
MQRADDVSVRWSVPGEFNEPKGPGDVSRLKEKGKVDPVDKKAEKKRIAAKAKADLEAGRIPAFRIVGTCEVLPSEALVAQSLGVTPPVSLPVSSDNAAIPPCPAVQITVNVSQLSPPRASLTSSSRPTSELSSESSLPKRRRTTEVPHQRASGPLGNLSVSVPPRHDNRWSFSHTDDELPLVSSGINIGAELIRRIGGIEVKFPANLEDLLVPDRFLDWSRDLLNIINAESRIVGAYEAVELDRHKVRANSWEVSATANRQSAIDYAVQVEVLKGEKQRLEDKEKKRDVHLEVASAEIAELRASLEKSHLREDRPRKEGDGAHRRADEIAGGSSAQRARHSRGARKSLKKMVEAEYEIPPGLLENYAKEEGEYFAKVESLAADSLGDDILFSTPPPPPASPPRNVSSQVPEGISEHGSFLSPQDNKDGDLV